MIKNRKELEEVGVELANVRVQKNDLTKRDSELADDVKAYMEEHNLDKFNSGTVMLSLSETAQYCIPIPNALKVVSMPELIKANAITIDSKKFEALLITKNMEEQLSTCREQKGSFKRLNVKLGNGNGKTA